MIIDDNAWSSLTKEELIKRKEEWVCIKKSLKEMEILFCGKPYIQAHKNLFFKGEITDELAEELEPKSNLYGSKEVFANGFSFFLAWYHPSTEPGVLDKLVFKYLRRSGVYSTLKVLIREPANKERLDPDYGFFGPKAELLCRLFVRNIAPYRFERDGVEYDLRIPPSSVLSGIWYLGSQISEPREANNSLTNFSTLFNSPRFLNQAFEARKGLLTTAIVPEIELLESGFKSALEFYKEKSIFTDNKSKRYIRFRMLVGWFRKTYSAEILSRIDQWAEEVGYKTDWEKLADEYNDQFKIPYYENLD